MKNILVLLLLPILVCCSRNEDRVESYAAPKAPEAPSAQMPAALPAMPGTMPAMPGVAPQNPGATPAFAWKTPADWKPGPTSQFRIGSFEVAGAGPEKY